MVDSENKKAQLFNHAMEALKNKDIPDKERWANAIVDIQLDVQADRNRADQPYNALSMYDHPRGIFDVFADLHTIHFDSGESNKRLQVMRKSPERIALGWLEDAMRIRSYFDKAIDDLGLSSKKAS